MTILFLDFDGVLHPDAAHLENGHPVLRSEGALFMWAPLLVDLLTDFPKVRIVLSTSWVRELRFSRARDFLPESLRPLVIGSTWHSAMAQHTESSHRVFPTWWDTATRYQQIQRYVDRAQLTNWIAVDDHPAGWAENDLDKLIQTDSQKGLSDLSARQQLRVALKEREMKV